VEGWGGFVLKEKWKMMEVACLPRNQKNKSEENLHIAARYSTSQHDGVTWRPS
jgi:hypothetical protein